MEDYTAQQTLIGALLDPGRYPHRSQAVRLIETHISWVLLCGRYAYKIKKAVNLGFLDFTTLQARHYYCLEEIRLNRRLAPGIYLDVIPITGSAADPWLGTGEEPEGAPAVEYAVRMRRFASSRQMDRLLARGRVTVQHMDRLAAAIARFHGSLAPAEPGSGFGTCTGILSAAMANFTHLQSAEQYPDSAALAGLQHATEDEYAKCAGQFEQRRLQGMVRECHGDLHLGNIVLIGDEPVPFDCIEFKPDLRWIDVMSEVAFTMMDLLYRERPDLAFRFINAYLEATGDYAGVAVLPFYLAYRAMVRCMVSAIRAAQPGLAQRSRTRELKARRGYLALAERCIGRRPGALIITHGLPGSGKSTFAQLALQKLPGIRIRSDVERKRLFGLDPLDDSRVAGSDIYTAGATQRTYARLGELAQAILGAGFTVIVDAAFLRQSERQRFRELARSMGVPFLIASVTASAATMHARIARRQSAKQDASEAGHAVLQSLSGIQEPLAPDELADTAEFDNESLERLLAAPAWHRLEQLTGGGAPRL